MRTINIHEAKTHLSRLVDLAAKGESFIIAKAGKPLVKVTPLDSPAGAEMRRLGFMSGQLAVPEDFDRMGEAEIERLFEGDPVNVLLDTHILLWAASSPERISGKGRGILEDKENALFFSAASFFEIVIKRALGRSDFIVEPALLWRGLRDNGYTELPITTAHTLMLESLPALHKDPFDRILVAQALVEGMTLLTSDAVVARYPGPIKKL